MTRNFACECKWQEHKAQCCKVRWELTKAQDPAREVGWGEVMGFEDKAKKFVPDRVKKETGLH